MFPKEKIERINFLAKKKKTEGLTPEEQKEQDELRRQYIDAIKDQLVKNMDAMGIPKKAKKHTTDCDCGCNHKH